MGSCVSQSKKSIIYFDYRVGRCELSETNQPSGSYWGDDKVEWIVSEKLEKGSVSVSITWLTLKDPNIFICKRNASLCEIKDDEKIPLTWSVQKRVGKCSRLSIFTGGRKGYIYIDSTDSCVGTVNR
jgi:hypothetical protein